MVKDRREGVKREGIEKNKTCHQKVQAQQKCVFKISPRPTDFLEQNDDDDDR